MTRFLNGGKEIPHTCSSCLPIKRKIISPFPIYGEWLKKETLEGKKRIKAKNSGDSLKTGIDREKTATMLGEVPFGAVMAR